MNGVLSTPYAMSKAAVEAFGRSLRVELAGTGVDVGIAYFGFIDTKLVRDAFDKPGIAELLESFPRFVAKPVPVEHGRAGDGRRRRARARPASPRRDGCEPLIPLRGFLHALDSQMTRDAKVRKAVDGRERSDELAR